jgi:hypothetical protein
MLAFQVLLAKRSLKIQLIPMYVRFGLCDFWLFTMLKISRKGHRLSDISIQGRMMTIMNSIPEIGFQRYYKLWEHWLCVCVHVAIRRDYFPGDGDCKCVSN